MQKVLDFLGVPADQIIVRRVPPVGLSASYAAAHKQATDLRTNPLYTAETKTRSKETSISRAELDALVAAGATLDGPMDY